MSPPYYATVQDAGREFTTGFYGRLNATGRARSVADMFAERARFYAMDVPETRPAVGRADAVEALRRFCRAYGGCGDSRRCITVVSVDARDDADDDGRCRDCGGSGHDGRRYDRYELFVRAEWTLPADARARRPLAPATPFVQTFRVRRLRAPGHHDGAVGQPRPFEILNTTVKTMLTVADAPSTHDLIHSERENKLSNTPRIQSNDYVISSDKKQLSAGDAELKSSSAHNSGTATTSARPSYVGEKPPGTRWSYGTPGNLPHNSGTATTSARPSYVGEKPPGTRWSYGTPGNFPHKRMAPHREFSNYQKRVETFLKGASDGDGDAPPARLCVDGLDGSFKADDLYDAFGRFGTVLWVRLVPADKNNLDPGYGARSSSAGRSRPNVHSVVRLVGHVCFERPEALTRALTEQRVANGCLVRGTRMSVRKFVAPDQ